jgi:multidrug efflux pump subunit AcrA (membrane-fusion protein)
MAAPGQPVFFLDSPSLSEIHAVVSESLVGNLNVGQETEVRIDALDRTMKGEIREIVPQSDSATRTVQVKIGLPPGEDIVNGLFGRIYVPYGSYEALVIPARAVKEVGQLYLVNTLGPDGRPVRRFIKPGRARDSFVEVLSGLKEGEEVVVP